MTHSLHCIPDEIFSFLSWFFMLDVTPPTIFHTVLVFNLFSYILSCHDFLFLRQHQFLISILNLAVSSTPRLLLNCTFIGETKHLFGTMDFFPCTCSTAIGMQQGSVLSLLSLMLGKQARPIEQRSFLYWTLYFKWSLDLKADNNSLLSALPGLCLLDFQRMQLICL